MASGRRVPNLQTVRYALAKRGHIAASTLPEDVSGFPHSESGPRLRLVEPESEAVVWPPGDGGLGGEAGLPQDG